MAGQLSAAGHRHRGARPRGPVPEVHGLSFSGREGAGPGVVLHAAWLPGDQQGPAAGHGPELGFLQGGRKPDEAQCPEQRLRLRGGAQGAARPRQAPRPPGQ